MRQVASLVAFLCFLVVSYQFVSAGWTPPSALPPNGNSEPPINVGTTTQTKNGNLVVDTLAAVSEVWSDNYCDAVGGNCNPQVGAPPSPFTYGRATGTFSGSYKVISGNQTYMPENGSKTTFDVTFATPYTAKPIISISEVYSSSTFGICDPKPVLTEKADFSGFVVVYTVSNADYAACYLPFNINWVAVNPN